MNCQGVEGFWGQVAPAAAAGHFLSFRVLVKNAN